ncbi:amino acid ABC transporter permease [Neopoerus faecalis]|uniref:amino acid ABC transporter permease n=1 Tax=Neopoerus faecalis TaxID=3032125 RepID=UPI00257071AC|nr:amino acid ABC transporter permease [Neopoerus faecalis]
MEKVGKLLVKYYPVYLSGLWGTLWISAVTVLFGALLGVLVALMRMSRFKLLRGISKAYIEVLRGTPILLQLYFFWIGLPKLVPFELSDTQCIVAALAVNASAFISEIIRAGIGAVDKGQWEAARSIGLSESHVMSHVIFPQAVKNILPALCNEFISTVKGTSLASVFFVGELMTSFKTVQSATFLALQSLTIVGVIYFVLNFVLSRLLGVLERRLTVSD